LGKIAEIQTCCDGLKTFPIDKAGAFMRAKGVCCDAQSVNFCTDEIPNGNGKLTNC